MKDESITEVKDQDQTPVWVKRVLGRGAHHSFRLLCRHREGEVYFIPDGMWGRVVTESGVIDYDYVIRDHWGCTHGNPFFDLDGFKNRLYSTYGKTTVFKLLGMYFRGGKRTAQLYPDLIRRLNYQAEQYYVSGEVLIELAGLPDLLLGDPKLKAVFSNTDHWVLTTYLMEHKTFNSMVSLVK